MDTKELCDLLEIKSGDEKLIKTAIANKLGPIIRSFKADWHTSISAIKGGRAQRDLEYIKEKGLLFVHREDTIKGKDTVLYKLTDKGLEAYKAYEALEENQLASYPPP